MTRVIEYKIRPLLRDNPKDLFRIFLSPANFLQMKNGDICSIESPQGVAGPAIAWTATEKLKDDVVQTSRALQKMYGLKPESRVSISHSNQSFMAAFDVTLREIPLEESEIPLPSLDEKDSLGWTWLLENCLRKADIFTPGLIFDNVDAMGVKKAFQIQQINSSDSRALYRAHSGCKVRITDATLQDDKHHRLFASSEGVGGLTTQFEEVNSKLKDYGKPLVNRCRMDDLYRPFRSGIILHGAPGTGKSLVLRKIAEAGWRGVFYINRTILESGLDESKANISRIFSNALRSQPSVVIIDHLDIIAGERDAQDSGRPVCIRQLLLDQLERLCDTRTLAVGAARKLSDLDTDLRGAGYFNFEIEIPVPDAESRADILKVLGSMPRNKGHATLDSIGARTHGFVGADLRILLERATIKYYSRLDDLLEQRGEANMYEAIEPNVKFMEMHGDLNNALSRVHPTAMQEIFVETPNVKWDDIGGQHEVKQVLEEALVWPFKYPKDMAELQIKPKKGLLLYGPPGCSKTMTAKAAATESGLNFIAVKGSELMSMYVGESERALRQVFSKAQAVKPSIIFFDEIDAIGATSAGGQHGSVQTVTTLLTEMDGFEAMEGVFVLAATNKPEILDPALLRAGRLDTTIYVGLPDVEARRAILSMQVPTNTDHADDIDQNALSEVTESLSGAEIVQLCENARNAALRERIESREKRWLGQRHFNIALAKAEKSVTPQMMQGYEAWGAGRR